MPPKSTRLEELGRILVDPDYPDEILTYEGDAFRSARSGRRYPVRPEGFVDFVNVGAVPTPPAPASRGGLVFRLNEYYNQHLEQRIARSVFADGGLACHFHDHRIRDWLAPIDGLVVDVGCGDRKAEALIGSRSCYFGVDYLPVTQFSPWRTGFPDINADALRLPLRSDSADCVLSMSVLEHVTSPERLVNEICRVVRPGGLAVLTGPGDITMSHGEPYNFFQHDTVRVPDAAGEKRIRD